MLRASLICGLVLLMTSLGPISAQEGDALIKIMQKWKGNLIGWEANTNHCTWSDVQCDGQNNVVFLNLSSKGLTGPVPEEMGSLQKLRFLDISMNEIRGDLSPLESLKNLQVLNISFNILGGGFPDVVLKLTELVDLRLDNLYLSGPFPTSWKALKNLQYLYLGNNTMAGTFPLELAELSNLKELTLWNNTLNSALPPELGSLSKLTYFNVHHCSMWGPLPPEFSKLQNMEKLYLYNNFFTGKVPESWRDMINLKDLRLQYNFLTGKEFPSWIPNHPKLSKMYLSYNYMYSPFPNLTQSKFSLARLECCYYQGPKPVKPPFITEFYYEGNCFSDQTNENANVICSRVTTCAGFQKRLNAYGCPECPGGQISLNATECICGQVLGSTSGSANSYIKIIVPIAVGLVLVLLISIFMYLLSKGRGNRRRFNTFFNIKTDDDWEAPTGVQRFTIEAIAKATNNFHEKNEIGAGGFGKVFVGSMESGKKLAIKRASIASLQGSTEFRNEVMLLSRLHHRNLVRLEGFCEDDGLRKLRPTIQAPLFGAHGYGTCTTIVTLFINEEILVYEFMVNGNLHTLLFPKNGIRHLLRWHKRLEISLGIAQGLDYLHSFADPPVIHRDIKPSNILLDENLNAKLSDFGLSKATPEFETHLSTSPAGTAGFIDPQYFLRQQLTTASDVYGFGVVLLELITGQKAIDQSRKEESNLVEWVKLMMKAEGIRGIVDPFLGPDYPEKIYKEFIDLALKCALFEREFRPTMKEIVAILENLLQSATPILDFSGSSKESTFDMSEWNRATDLSNRSNFSNGATSQIWNTGNNLHPQLLPR